MSSRLPYLWKYETRFDLSRPDQEDTENSQIRPIFYAPCDCQGKYPFKNNSPLLGYLQKSEGWVNDARGEYTLNYILINLFAIISSKKLFCEDGKMGQMFLYFKPDLELQEALKLPNDYKICIREIRHFIANNHLEGHKTIITFRTAPFACTNKIGRKTRKLIYSILGQPPRIEWLIAHHSM